MNNNEDKQKPLTNPPVDGLAELTDDEKHLLLIEKLKESKKIYLPKKCFDAKYRKKRQNKNSQQKKSRRINRKK